MNLFIFTAAFILIIPYCSAAYFEWDTEEINLDTLSSHVIIDLTKNSTEFVIQFKQPLPASSGFSCQPSSQCTISLVINEMKCESDPTSPDPAYLVITMTTNGDAVPTQKIERICAHVDANGNGMIVVGRGFDSEKIKIQPVGTAWNTKDGGFNARLTAQIVQQPLTKTIVLDGAIDRLDLHLDQNSFRYEIIMNETGRHYCDKVAGGWTCSILVVLDHLALLESQPPRNYLQVDFLDKNTRVRNETKSVTWTKAAAQDGKEYFVESSNGDIVLITAVAGSGPLSAMLHVSTRFDSEALDGCPQWFFDCAAGSGGSESQKLRPAAQCIPDSSVCDKRQDCGGPSFADESEELCTAKKDDCSRDELNLRKISSDIQYLNSLVINAFALTAGITLLITLLIFLFFYHSIHQLFKMLLAQLPYDRAAANRTTLAQISNEYQEFKKQPLP